MWWVRRGEGEPIQVVERDIKIDGVCENDAKESNVS